MRYTEFTPFDLWLLTQGLGVTIGLFLATSLVGVFIGVPVFIWVPLFIGAPVFIWVFAPAVPPGVVTLVLTLPVAGVCTVWAPAVPAAATRAKVSNVRFMGCLPPWLWLPCNARRGTDVPSMDSCFARISPQA